MMPKITYGSVCSGIEAATCAWEPFGWVAEWLAEIEPFPSAVLKHHYPNTPNLGDMTTISERVLRGEVSAPDVLTGGTPCQAFSVAGLRKGLADERGQLSLQFCKLANAIDNIRSSRGDAPAIIVWENVPGVLSDKGNAFGCFLAGLAGEDDALQPPGGKWSNAGAVVGPTRTVCWRVLDAQYFGVAQRRRRVWVVASARKGFDPAAVLFEFDGVRRDSPPCREAREGAAGGAVVGAAVSSGQGWWSDAKGVAATVRAQDSVNKADTLCFGGGNTSGPIPVATALNANRGCHNPGDFEAGTLIAFPAEMSGTQFAAQHDRSPSLSVKHTTAVAFSCKYHGADAGEISPTLSSMGHDDSHANGGGQMAVALCEGGHGLTEIDTVPTLQSQGGGKPGQGYHAVRYGMQVRRLTPVECERLQGFPDGYTAIPWRGKPADKCPDGPRYKALGNSWAVPCAAWIGQRVHNAISRHANDNMVTPANDNALDITPDIIR